MPPSGQQMLEQSISTCQQIADGLGTRDPDWETSVVEIADKFGDLSGTFFFQTMPSVPPTRTAMRDADALLGLKSQGDWNAFGPALTKLIVSAQDVIEKAGMKGTTLT
jgi:hypothetical protein